MKITVIVENQSNDKLEHEHGLSLFIEYKDKRYLLDTGASDLYLENARELGLDLSQVDAAILSMCQKIRKLHLGYFLLGTIRQIWNNEATCMKFMAGMYFHFRNICINGLQKVIILNFENPML